MLGRKHEFKPDKTGSGWLSKLYITPKQRMKLLRWALYILALLIASLIQDVLFCRFSVLGGSIDLLSCCIFLLAVLLDPDDSAVFCLICSVLLYFSGNMAGSYGIIYVTFLGSMMSIFRFGFLQKGFLSTFLCTGISIMLYELAIYFTGLFLKQTTGANFLAFTVTGAVSLLCIPVIYPCFVSIGKIGGSSWKD
jgi:hypothetical protein